MYWFDRWKSGRDGTPFGVPSEKVRGPSEGPRSRLL